MLRVRVSWLLPDNKLQYFAFPSASYTKQVCAVGKDVSKVYLFIDGAASCYERNFMYYLPGHVADLIDYHHIFISAKCAVNGK